MRFLNTFFLSTVLAVYYGSHALAQFGPQAPPDPSVTIDINITEADSIVVRQDAGGTSSQGPFGPDAVIDALVGGGQIPDFRVALQELRNSLEEIRAGLSLGIAVVSGAPVVLQPEVFAQEVALINGLEQAINNQLLAQGTNEFGAANLVAAVAAINTGAFDSIRQVINDLPDGDLVNRGVIGQNSFIEQINQSIAGFITTINNTDPYVSLHGSLTNTSATETLDLNINFEQGLFDALPLDTPLVRQVLLDVELEDTNGDGVAAARSASFGFSAFGTDDPNNPTLVNTAPLGSVESAFDFIGDFSDNTIEAGLRIVAETDFVDLSAQLVPGEVPEGTLITHLLGGLSIEDLSPGDTVNFTAILSVGIDGNPTVPLIPVENLESIFGAAQLIGTFPGFVPEPSSLLLAVGASSLLLSRRKFISMASVHGSTKKNQRGENTCDISLRC